MKTIVKVQVPLFPKGAPALVYNKDRSVMQQCPVDASLKKLMRGRAKAYFAANIEGGKIRLIRQTPDQDW